MTLGLVEEKETAVSRLIQLAGARAAKGPSWLQELRGEARTSLARMGFPTCRQEDWRNTNIDSVKFGEFLPADEAAETDGSVTATAAENLFFDTGAARLSFLNGVFSPALSNLSFPDGVIVEPFSQAWARGESCLQEHLGRYAGVQERPFAALNLAFCREGVLVKVPPGKVLEEPIQLVFFNHSEAGSALMAHPRVLVLAEENSQVRVLETHLGSGEGSFLNNAVTEICAGEAAVVDYYKLQQESDNCVHLGTVESYQGRGSSVRTSIVSLCGGLIRNDTGAVLAGEGANAELDGLYLVAGQHHVDNFTRIEHAAPKCGSRELYKGILMDRGTGVFRGRIIVQKGAQKTDSKQTNNNLLLSDSALINTKPQLEIYADDVKCTHGATIGRLDGDSLFYLRARGISLEDARSMLIYAFANEVVRRVRFSSLQKELDEYLFNWLPAARSLGGASEQ